MTRFVFVPLLAFAFTVPAAAYVFLHRQSSPPICFDTGNAVYRIASAGSADVTVRVEENPAHPDLRVQIIDDPLVADFVLVDDGPGTCPYAPRSLRVVGERESAQLTVGLSRAPADYKAYVNSGRFSQSQAAAIFAVEWKAGRDRLASAR
jgi:hypothetical protein